MATNLAIDDSLIEEAVTKALEEYIRFHRQRRILEAAGTFDFDPTYDYKAERRRKRMG